MGPRRKKDKGAGGGGGGGARAGPGLGAAAASAVAGAVAGAVARVVVGPLDVLKIRFQVQLEPIARAAADGARAAKYWSLRQAVATIAREEGIQALWRGTVPGLLLTVPYTAVQFLALQQARALEARLGASPARAPALAFANGALAGAAGTVASYPFDLLRTTLAAQGEPRVYAGMADAARGIVGAGGARGLYRGLGVTLLEIMPYAALQFGLYDVFSAAADRARAARRGGAGAAAGGAAPARARGADALQAVACGLAAGTLAKLGTHPLDVAKKRFQVAGLARAARYGERVSLASVRSLRACVAEIFAREGAAGFYKGAVPSVAKAAPAAAVTFFVYELVVGALAAPGEASGAAARRPQH